MTRGSDVKMLFSVAQSEKTLRVHLKQLCIKNGRGRIKLCSKRGKPLSRLFWSSSVFSMTARDIQCTFFACSFCRPYFLATPLSDFYRSHHPFPPSAWESNDFFVMSQVIWLEVHAILGLFVLLVSTSHCLEDTNFYGSDLSCQFLRRFDDEIIEMHYVWTEILETLEMLSHVCCVIWLRYRNCFWAGKKI